MIIKNEAQVTDAVLTALQKTTDPRLREILLSLVQHLHAFVRDVKLTEAEFRQAAALINSIGQASSDTHNEAVLLAGSLGVSQLVCLMNNTQPDADVTTQSVLGPFWRLGSPATENGESIVRCETPGQPLFVELVFCDESGNPVADAKVDIWHCSAEGLYENQDNAQAFMNLRGQFTTGDDGKIWFSSIKPSGYPIPTEAVAGALVEAQQRHAFRPAHLHALAYKAGYKTLISQIYANDDPHLDSDVQFGVTAALVGHYQHHSEAHPDNACDSDWYSLSHTLVMQAGEARLPEPPIR